MIVALWLITVPKVNVIMDASVPEKQVLVLKASSEVTRLKPDAAVQELLWLEQAKKECKRARDQAIALEYGPAITRFEEAIELYARAIPAIAAFKEVAQCFFELGAAAVDAKQVAKANEAFRRAHLLDPALKPNDVVYSPAVVKTFDAASLAMEKTKRTSLTLVGEPKGAEVLIDGHAVGTLPASVSNLVVGEHWIAVRAPYRKTFSARFIADKTPKLEVFLVEKEGPSIEDRIAAGLAAVSGPDASQSADLARFAKGAQATAYLRLQGDRYFARVYDHQTKRAGEIAKFMALEDVAAFIDAQIAPVSSAPKVIQPATAIAPARATTRVVHPAVAILPLGVGQFVEKRPIAGSLFLASEILLLGANIACWWIAKADEVSPQTYRDANKVSALKIVINVSFGLLAADVIAGAVDGLLHREVNE